MSDIALTNATAYAARHNLRLAERLGFGIHGTPSLYPEISQIREDFLCGRRRTARWDSTPYLFWFQLRRSEDSEPCARSPFGLPGCAN